jgi:hypothetical protein
MPAARLTPQTIAHEFCRVLGDELANYGAMIVVERGFITGAAPGSPFSSFAHVRIPRPFRVDFAPWENTPPSFPEIMGSTSFEMVALHNFCVDVDSDPSDGILSFTWRRLGPMVRQHFLPRITKGWKFGSKLVTGELDLPAALSHDGASRCTGANLSVRVIQAYDPLIDTWRTRYSVLFGFTQGIERKPRPSRRLALATKARQALAERLDELRRQPVAA